ncbi:ketodeoxygluconokinase [Azorhizobium oxalatiphilum]|uniref:Ketodeoxygluconokinase n=1 Tax=Azorhizobium oxalatiphilum TaxID=980631 RepID=A0A917CAT2_9HYPH|nr:sugar kinase [Azorhizobium oxalatiphilum]GGF77069.1 ketodeoxygluconokinase [Azorhizobium oxalatiphilum]
MVKVVSVGEVMVELARGDDGRFGQAFGGDTFNTAVYLARAGIDTAYATALGDDIFSAQVIALAASEGLATDAIVQVPGRMPGLYIITTDAKGERTFHYWRDNAPARQLFELDGWQSSAEKLVGAQAVYFSGITLSLYSNAGLGRFLASLEVAGEGGAWRVFDGNFRPRGWQNDLPRARMVFAEALKRSSMALPTFEDEAMLWGDASPEATIARITTFGVKEVVVKNGPGGAYVHAGGQTVFVPVEREILPVDTTGAGDSFNAGYLAARLKGETPEAAARAGHALAGTVIMHRGAIIPRLTQEGVSAH